MQEREKLITERHYSARRLKPKQAMVVAGKTIGTSMTYNLAMQNVSRSGLLLGGGNYKSIPFTTNTLLELTIDTKSRVLAEPLNCLGKVVRIEDNAESEEGPAFGIQIIGVDDSPNPELWVETVRAMENADPLTLPKAG